MRLRLALPRPDAGARLAHETPDAADQSHTGCVRTSIGDEPPVELMVGTAWLTSKRHIPACCVTAMRASPTRSPLLRAVGSGLASTLNVRLPSPCPCAPDVSTAQLASDDADQAHSLETLMAIEPVPPSAPNERAEESKLG